MCADFERVVPREYSHAIDKTSVKYHRHFAEYSAMHWGKIRRLIGATSAEISAMRRGGGGGGGNGDV